MTDWTATLIVVGAGAYVVRRRLRAVAEKPTQVDDIAKAGELFGTAADWLRNGDVDYTALLDYLPEPTAGDDATEAEWVPVDDALAPGAELAFDHHQIIYDALRVAL